MENLNSVINDSCLPNMLEHAEDLSSSLKSYSAIGDEYQKLLDHSAIIEPIISLKSRLDQYIDEPGKFDDAIVLLEEVDQLNRKYGHQVPVISHIHNTSHKQRGRLVSNLCHRLESMTDSSLDELKFLVDQLVRCGNFSDRELKLKYLQARDNWFNNECEAKGDSFDDLITFFCNGLPTIFQEYKSIFVESIDTATNAHHMPFSTDDTSKEDGAIINSWLLLKTSTFILSLEVHLKTLAQSKQLTPTMVGDTMQKCIKLTNWLASTGFDFSSRLKPIFSRAIVEELKYSIEEATMKFERDFTSIISKSIESLLLPVDDGILRISNMRPEEQVPKSIENYPIFKIYCLNLMDSLRWIQTTKNVLSPISCCLDTYAALNSSLTRVMKALAAVLNMDNNSNHPILSKIAISFLTEVLPFVTNYCELLFPEKVILNAIGLSKIEFKAMCANEPERLKNFRLDLRQIGDPLRGVMPALMRTIES